MTKEDAIDAFKKLKEWVPSCVDLEAISKVNYPPSKDYHPVFEDGDDVQPFFSEAYLYNLLGKEDARTLLALIRKLAIELDLESAVS